MFIQIFIRFTLLVNIFFLPSNACLKSFAEVIKYIKYNSFGLREASGYQKGYFLHIVGGGRKGIVANFFDVKIILDTQNRPHVVLIQGRRGGQQLFPLLVNIHPFW